MGTLIKYKIMKTYLILLFSLLFVLSCTNEADINNNSFIFPTIDINYKKFYKDKDSLTVINVDSLQEQFSGYVFGKYPKQKTEIQIEEFNSNHLEEIKILVDYDTIQSDGLQIKIDTNQIVIDPFYYNLFGNKTSFLPVAIINETSEAKAISTITNRILLIQEIYYEPYNNWLAINQPQIFGMCGQDYSSIILNPEEYIIVNAPIYDGNQLIKMRIKIKIGGNVFISNTYKSRINLSQILLTHELKKLLTRYSRQGSMGESFADFLPFLKQE